MSTAALRYRGAAAATFIGIETEETESGRRGREQWELDFDFGNSGLRIRLLIWGFWVKERLMVEEVEKATEATAPEEVAAAEDSAEEEHERDGEDRVNERERMPSQRERGSSSGVVRVAEGIGFGNGFSIWAGFKLRAGRILVKRWAGNC